MDHHDRIKQDNRPLKRDRPWKDNPHSKRPPITGMPSTLRVLLRSIDAGGIIGKGGENIKRMRKKYDCQVQLPDSAGNPERVLTVIGDKKNCVGVFEECLEKVKNEIKRRDVNAPIEVQVLIPQPFMGTIIGTGGMKIKDLRKHTNCIIKIFSEPMPFSNERSISLTGSEQEIISCVTFFLQEIGQREPKEPIILYDPAVPPDMPPPFDYPPGPQHGFGGGRGRGRGGRGGGRHEHGGGRGGRGGGHHFRNQPHHGHGHQGGPPQPPNGPPPPGLLPPTGPPTSGPPKENTNTLLPPPQFPPSMNSGGLQQIGNKANSSFGQQGTGSQQQGPPSSAHTVQYPTPPRLNTSNNSGTPPTTSNAPAIQQQITPPTQSQLPPGQQQQPPQNQPHPPANPPQPLGTGTSAAPGPSYPPGPLQVYPSTSNSLLPPNPPSQGYSSYPPPPTNSSQGNFPPSAATGAALPQQQAPPTGLMPPPPLVSQPQPTQYPNTAAQQPLPLQTPFPNQQVQPTPPVQPLPTAVNQDGSNYYNQQPAVNQGQFGHYTTQPPAQPTSGYPNTAPPYQPPPTHPSYPPPPIPPPAQPYYGGANATAQYPAVPNPVFPAANSMQGVTTSYQQPQVHTPETKQVTIPLEFASAILGPGGSKIQQIRSQSRCTISMEDPKPNSTERVITIIGSSADIVVAEQLMKDSVRQHHKV